MDVLGWLTIAIPIALGAHLLLFSRRAILGISRFQEGVLRRPYTEFELRFGQVLAVIVGAILLVGGLFIAVQRVTA